MSRRIKAILTLTVFIASAFIVSACGGAVSREVTINKDESWEATMQVSLPHQVLAMIGPLDELDHELETGVVELKEEDVDASWKKSEDDEGVTYTIEAKGSGLDKLNDTVFDGSAEIVAVEEGGKQVILFAYSSGISFMDASSNSLTLHGSEILSGNGDITSKGTIQWVNYSGVMQATMIPAGGTSFWSVILLLLFVGGLAAGGWYLWQRSKKIGTAAYEAPANEKQLCAYCQTPMSPGAKFCPQCGKEQPITPL